MNPWMNVRGFQPFSLCDWSGRAVSVIFMGHCNFRCPTCHNWDLAVNPKTIDNIPRQTIMNYLADKREWLDGVVVTGGEPTITPGFLDVLEEIREVGLPINLHTNGANPKVMKECLDRNLVEVFSVDVKGPWALYPKLTGGRISPEAAERHLSHCFDWAYRGFGQFYFRTTLVPFLTDRDVEICRSYLPDGHELHVQQYREPEHLIHIEKEKSVPVRSSVAVEAVI